MTSNCLQCTRELTYDYRNVKGETVIFDIYQVDGNYYCLECLQRILELTHHVKKSGRKNIKISYEIDRPTYPRGRLIKKEDDCND